MREFGFRTTFFANELIAQPARAPAAPPLEVTMPGTAAALPFSLVGMDVGPLAELACKSVSG